MIKVALINDTRSHSHYGCSLVMDNLVQLLQQYGFSVEWSWPVHKDWRLHQQELLELPKVDMVIVNGEGTINNSHRKKYAQALIEFAEFSCEHISPYCYLINATLFNNAELSYQQLKTYRAIFVRDRASLKELREQGCDGRWVPDLTFYGAASTACNHVGNGVAVTDNTLRPMAKRLKGYAQEKGYQYITMSLAHPRNKSFWKSPRTFFKNTWNWWFWDRHRSPKPNAYIAQLKECRFVITGRFHTVTMCLKNRIPFVAIASNTPKIEHLLEDLFGKSDRVVSIEDIEKGEFPENPAFSQKELQQIDQFMSITQEKIEAKFSAIRTDFIGHNSHKLFEYPEALMSE